MARGGPGVHMGLGQVAAALLGGAALGLASPEAAGPTASGFAISPFGHVLTSRHVVASEGFTQGREAAVSVRPEVERIEVVVAGETGERRFEASVVAENPDLDLALLAVAGADLPYLSLGDSDALDAGQSIRSPKGDFTVAFRAAFWSASTLADTDAAAACGGSPGTTCYVRRTQRLTEGVIGEGLFLKAAEGLVQLEVESPPAKERFVRGLLRAWVEARPHP